MSFEAMNVKIGADISDLQQAGAKTNTIFASIAQNAAKANVAVASLGAAQGNVSKNLAITAVAATKADSALLKTTGSSDRAGNALMNLGRIAQDAPFGFIGISNNINPLLESFQRLQKESGSTSGALKALGGSLLGGGGLGLAVSVATGLLTVLAQQGFFKAAKGADELAEKTKKYKEIEESANESLAKEVVNLRVLVSLATDVSKPYDARKRAVDELQKAYPAYLGNLADEKILNGEAAAEINKVTEALYAKAYAEAASGKAADVLGKVIDLRKKENDLIKQRETAFKGVSNGDIKVYGEAAMTFPILNKQIKDVRDQIIEANKEADFFIKEGEKFKASSIELTKGPKAEKDKAHIRDVDDVLKELNTDLLFNQRLQSIGFISSTEQDVKKIERVKSAIEEIIKLKKGKALSIEDPVVLNLLDSITPEETRQQIAKIREGAIALMSVEPIKLNAPVSLKPVIDKSYSGKDDGIKDFSEATRAQIIKELSKFGSKGTNNIGIKVSLDILNDDELDKNLTKARKRYNAYLESVEGSVKSTAGAIASTIAETLGDAFSGENVNLFGNLFQVIGAGLKQLGEAEIAYATSLIVLKKAIVNPFAALAAGIAAITLGQVLQNSLPKFATGGLVGGSGNTDSVPALLMPGEFVMTKEAVGRIGVSNLLALNSNSIVRLPQVDQAIPNSRLNQIGSQGPQVVVLTPRIQGSDLLLVHDRATQQRARRS